MCSISLKAFEGYGAGVPKGRLPFYMTMNALFRVSCTVPDLPFKLLELSYDIKKEVQRSMEDH